MTTALTAMDSALDRLLESLQKLNSTNWLTFSGTLMSGITGLVYLTGVMVNRHPNLDTFAAWLAFLATWLFAGVRQFRHKRYSHSEFGPQAQPAGGNGHGTEAVDTR